MSRKGRIDRDVVIWGTVYWGLVGLFLMALLACKWLFSEPPGPA